MVLNFLTSSLELEKQVKIFYSVKNAKQLIVNFVIKQIWTQVRTFLAKKVLAVKIGQNMWNTLLIQKHNF